MRKLLTFDDVCMVPNYCEFESRKDVDTSVTISTKNAGNFTFAIPVVSSPMDTVTGYEMARALGTLGGLSILHRFTTLDELEATLEKLKKVSGFMWDRHIGVAYGAGDKELERVDLAYKLGFRIFCLDIAHAHSKAGGDAVQRVKDKYPDALVIAGSVCTLAGADFLIGKGADVIRVGISVGSACITNVKTGFGTPQFSTILECAKCSKPIIADGGIRKPSDAAKALAAGATMVMLGGMLARAYEAEGDVTYKTENGYLLESFVDDATFQKVMSERPPVVKTNLSTYYPYKTYRGMASKEVNKEYFGGLAEWKTAEGVSTTVKIIGTVADIIKDLVGGIRSALTYAGAENLQVLPRRVEFVERTHSGYIESTAHIQS
jgi:IMP dehydrogenase